MKLKTRYYSFFLVILKNYKWSTLLQSLVMFLIFPVILILELTSYDRLNTSVEKVGSDLINYFLYSDAEAGIYCFTSRGYGALYISLVIGMIAGVFALYYLHNSQQVTFYHSLPISRKRFISIKFFAATISYVVPLVCANIIYLLVVFSHGLGSLTIVKNLMIFLFYNLIMYWIGYFASAIGMLLSTKLFMGVLESIIFIIYTPVLAYVLSILVELSYDTIYVTSGSWLGNFQFIADISPIFYIRNIQWNAISDVFKMIGVVVILWLIQKFLITIRPSEAAGKAIIYRGFARIIKWGLAFQISLSTGLIFYAVAYSSLNWLYFGAIFGLITSYIVIQLSYDVAFKELLKEWIQILVLAIGSIGVLSIFIFDVFEFDTYIPEYESIKNINIEFNIGSSYSNIIEDGLYEAQMGKDEATYQFMRLIIESANSVAEGTEATFTDISTQSNNKAVFSNNTITIYVEYELENGSLVIREYKPYLADVREGLKSLWGNEEFLNAMYPIRIQNTNYVHDVSIDCTYNEELLNMYYSFDDEIVKQQGFIAAYQKDMEEIGVSEIVNEVPIGTVSYIYDYKEENNISITSKWFRFSIYPSYTNTLNFLSSEGIELNEGWDLDEIERVVVTSSAGEVVYEEETEIAEVMENVVWTPLTTIFNITDPSRSVSIYLKGENYPIESNLFLIK